MEGDAKEIANTLLRADQERPALRWPFCWPRFKHFLDMPPYYLTSWRLELAAQQLKATDMPMKEIADQAGYESEAGFSRTFTRHFRLPTADWQHWQASPTIRRRAIAQDERIWLKVILTAS
jgi:hypothetical protein